MGEVYSARCVGGVSRGNDDFVAVMNCSTGFVQAVPKYYET
jgi:hypothetical protein